MTLISGLKCIQKVQFRVVILTYDYDLAADKNMILLIITLKDFIRASLRKTLR